MTEPTDEARADLAERLERWAEQFAGKSWAKHDVRLLREAARALRSTPEAGEGRQVSAEDLARLRRLLNHWDERTPKRTLHGESLARILAALEPAAATTPTSPSRTVTPPSWPATTPPERRATMTDTCPTCGSPVEVVSSDEGTSHYQPTSRVDPEDVELLRKVLDSDTLGRAVHAGGATLTRDEADALRRVLAAVTGGDDG